MSVYSYGTVGHTSMHHVILGEWQGPGDQSTWAKREKRNTPLCDRAKRCGRVIKAPDPAKLCGACRQLVIQAGNTHELPVSEYSPSELQDYAELVVRLGDLSVDPAVQRKEQRTWSREIAADFSWSRFNENPPKVSVRADGFMHIFDGQHEVAAARIAGWPPDTKVKIHAWYGLTKQQEAEKFGHQHARHAVRAIDKFQQFVMAETEPYVTLNRLLLSYGWEVGSAGAEGHFAAVTHLVKLYLKHGLAPVDATLQTITTAWGHQPEAAHQAIVTALGAFFAAYPGAEVSRMVEKLAPRMPERVQEWANTDPDPGKTCTTRLKAEYNKGLRNANRRL